MDTNPPISPIRGKRAAAADLREKQWSDCENLIADDHVDEKTITQLVPMGLRTLQRLVAKHGVRRRRGRKNLLSPKKLETVSKGRLSWKLKFKGPDETDGLWMSNEETDKKIHGKLNTKRPVHWKTLQRALKRLGVGRIGAKDIALAVGIIKAWEDEIIRQIGRGEKAVEYVDGSPCLIDTPERAVVLNYEGTPDAHCPPQCFDYDWSTARIVRVSFESEHHKIYTQQGVNGLRDWIVSRVKADMLDWYAENASVPRPRVLLNQAGDDVF